MAEAGTRARPSPCWRYFLSQYILYYGGRVVTDASPPTTRGVQELTRLLLQAPNLYTMIFPICDGVSVSPKLP